MPIIHHIKRDERSPNVEHHLTADIEGREDASADFDCENYDLNEALKQSLLEVEAHMKGEMDLEAL